MPSEKHHPEEWLRVESHGLYCAPGDFYIDPHRPVERAVVTHGHADHARPGHTHVLATPDTLAIMKARYGPAAAANFQPLDYGRMLKIGDLRVGFRPAGHVLGSAQAVVEWGGWRVVISGDFKRQTDPTCAPFEVVPCDLFVTEATFALPVFRHPPAGQELSKFLRSLDLFPERAHLLGAYSLGKAQRLIAMLRQAGYKRKIYLHGALTALCELYVARGVNLGELRPVSSVEKGKLAGAVIVAPPSALADRWSRRLGEPVTAMASGWMRVRARARQRGVELPLVISDHADWDDLMRTATDTGAGEVWVTHGNEEALVHALGKAGVRARALALIGRGEEEQEGA